MSEYSNLLVCESALHAIGIVAKVVVVLLSILIVVIVIVGLLGLFDRISRCCCLCGCREVLGLEGLQVLLSQKLLAGRFWDEPEVLGLTMVTGGICEVDMITEI